jgi:hypothetical protein
MHPVLFEHIGPLIHVSVWDVDEKREIVEEDLRKITHEAGVAINFGYTSEIVGQCRDWMHDHSIVLDLTGTSKATQDAFEPLLKNIALQVKLK